MISTLEMTSGVLEREVEGKRRSRELRGGRNANFLYIHTYIHTYMVVGWEVPYPFLNTHFTLSFHFNIHQLTAFVFGISSQHPVSDGGAWNS